VTSSERGQAVVRDHHGVLVGQAAADDLGEPDVVLGEQDSCRPTARWAPG